MQDTYKRIYEMATEELSRKPFNFQNETTFIYKGFRISKSIKGVYDWKDVRFNDYYDEVDPLITEKVLELGFVDALMLVMIHNDQDKLIQLERRIINIDKEIEYWVKMSTEIYNDKRKELTKITKSKTLKPETKEKRKATLEKKCEKYKALYEKKRRILKSEKDDIKADIVFYSSRIKSFNN
tara:strand:+ start:10496 stop:11041 length:546 start_codon:yes stop_codon:yes gene_type:complete